MGGAVAHVKEVHNRALLRLQVGLGHPDVLRDECDRTVVADRKDSRAQPSAGRDERRRCRRCEGGSLRFAIQATACHLTVSRDHGQWCRLSLFACCAKSSRACARASGRTSGTCSPPTPRSCLTSERVRRSHHTATRNQQRLGALPHQAGSCLCFTARTQFCRAVRSSPHNVNTATLRTSLTNEQS